MGIASLAGVVAVARRASASPAPQSLFRIERSKNANIVQYDAMVESPTSLDKSKPVVGYWIRKAEDGRRAEFSMLDRMAYGFSVDIERGSGAFILRLKAAENRPIRVVARDGRWVAEMTISGAPAVLDHLYVDTDESGTLPKVRYVDVFGVDARGRPVRERLEK